MIMFTRAGPDARDAQRRKARRAYRRACLLLAVFCGASCSALLGVRPAQADTVASLLGNFTVNQYAGLEVGDHEIDVHYAVVLGQLPALRELHAADTNGDGVTTQAERDVYVERLAPQLADSLALRVDGKRLPLRLVHWSSSLPVEQGGFSLRIDVDFAATPDWADGRPHALRFDNTNYPGQIGWHEIVVVSRPGIGAYATNAFATSLTGGLTQALQALPEAGPLDERSVFLTVTTGPLPPDAVVLGARVARGAQPVTAAASATAPATSATAAVATQGSWIERATHRLVNSISGARLDLGVILGALCVALVLGAVHALSPGHGKTIVGAYLIGSRGTPRHALFLGLTVTVTHTAGVFLLGFATLYASHYIMPERLFPILSLVSAALVLVMGGILLVQRIRAALRPPPAFVRVVAAPATPRAPLLAPAYATPDATWHSHGGGALHSHLPPGAAGERVTWRGLLALGISGGLVPCPSALVILLAAVALNKTWFGIVLVLAFSFGLAITLTGVGLAFLYARNRFRRPRSTSRWPLLLPVASAATMLLIGIGLCVEAVRSFA
jgi:ABC-type nickel/cobalt efflux system permease component RcnA